MKGNILHDNDNMLDASTTPHAGCYITGPIATTITNAGTYYLLAGTSTTLDLLLFSHTSPGRLTYNGTITKIFKCESKFSVIASSNNIILRTKLAKNGIVDSTSEQTSFKGTAADVIGFVTMSFISLAQGDYIEMYITCDNAGTTITANQSVLLITTV